MAVKSFDPNTPADAPETKTTTAAPAEGQQAGESQAPATRTESSITPYDDRPQLEGELQPRDFKLPRVNLVQRTGELANDFDPGTFVYDRQIILGDLETPWHFILLRMKLQWQQNIPFGSEEQSKVFDTLDEVRANGGHITYTDKDDTSYYARIAHVKLLLEAPASLPDIQKDLFIYEHKGALYAPAIWTLAKSQFNAAGKSLVTAAQTHLREGLHKGRWECKSLKKDFNRNTWYVPTVKPAGKLDEDDVRFAQELV